MLQSEKAVARSLERHELLCFFGEMLGRPGLANKVQELRYVTKSVELKYYFYNRRFAAKY
ncbi:MAG: hypothetical protein OWQ51_11460 [Pyrobaculum arsenaticum]|uniref:hypothetical protein n=1 Tax=Pyrobaculum arsenaticum TaxID=121277 RepID=UPI00227496A5|nr:hypothetical protein [Pyrobaculum arsenaticum]